MKKKRDKIIAFRGTTHLHEKITELAALSNKSPSSWMEGKLIELTNQAANPINVDSLNHYKGTQNLWLDSSGNTHIVPLMGHCAYGEKIGCCIRSKPECHLIAKEKWCKLSCGIWFLPETITKEQLDFISFWCALNEMPIPSDIPQIKGV